MDGVGAALFDGFKNPVEMEVAFQGLRRSDLVGLVRQFDMEGLRVGLGVNRGGIDAHIPQVRRIRTAISPRLAISIF